MSIINKHLPKNHPFSISFSCSDENTTSGIEHRCLTENEQREAFLCHMTSVLQTHHVSPDILERRRVLIESLRITNAPVFYSPYPRNPNTQKGNFAEIFLAEYLCSTTDAELPV